MRLNHYSQPSLLQSWCHSNSCCWRTVFGWISKIGRIIRAGFTNVLDRKSGKHEPLSLWISYGNELVLIFCESIVCGGRGFRNRNRGQTNEDNGRRRGIDQGLWWRDGVVVVYIYLIVQGRIRFASSFVKVGARKRNQTMESHFWYEIYCVNCF